MRSKRICRRATSARRSTTPCLSTGRPAFSRSRRRTGVSGRGSRRRHVARPADLRRAHRRAAAARGREHRGLLRDAMRLLVLVLGAHGQLGDAMTAQLEPRHEVISRGREELDVTVPDAVRATVGSICPDVIINCAAYTSVDAAQEDPLRALATNAWAVHTLARAAADIDATLVHFSTDFVFDGNADRPYDETSRRTLAAPTRCRSSSANGWPTMRRGITCCGSKASSAAVSRKAASTDYSKVSSRAGRCRRSSIARSRRVTSTTSWRRRRSCSIRPRRTGCITASTAAGRPGPKSRVNWRASPAAPTPHSRRSAGRRELADAASEVRGAVERQARQRGHLDADLAGCAGAVRKTEGRRGDSVGAGFSPPGPAKAGPYSPALQHLRDHFPNRERRGQPRRINTRRVNDEGVLPIAADQKICKALGRRVQLRPDAARAKPQVVHRD